MNLDSLLPLTINRINGALPAHEQENLRRWRISLIVRGGAGFVGVLLAGRPCPGPPPPLSAVPCFGDGYDNSAVVSTLSHYDGVTMSKPLTTAGSLCLNKIRFYRSRYGSLGCSALPGGEVVLCRDDIIADHVDSTARPESPTITAW